MYAILLCHMKPRKCKAMPLILTPTWYIGRRAIQRSSVLFYSQFLIYFQDGVGNIVKESKQRGSDDDNQSQTLRGEKKKKERKDLRRDKPRGFLPDATWFLILSDFWVTESLVPSWLTARMSQFLSFPRISCIFSNFILGVAAISSIAMYTISM